MDNNIDKQIQKLEELQKLYESEYFEKHNAFAIAIIEEIKKMIVSKNESLHLVSQQRELLESFREEWNKPRFDRYGIYKSDIDDFLEDSNESNCG